MSKKKFKYTKRSSAANKKRADQKGGKYANIFREELETFSTSDENRIRIFPAGWDEADHYGIDVYVHYGVGPENQQFLCRKEMGQGDCPVCSERMAVLSSDPEYAGKLKAMHRVAAWLLDRNDRKTGPKLWAMPWTVDRDISKLSINKENGELLPIDHPDEGYDVLFDMDGPKGGMKKYVGMEIARKSSPISKNDDRQEEWLQFITDNPVVDCLNFYSEQHIEACFGAAAPDDDDEDERVSRKSRGSSSKAKGRDDDDDDDGDDDEDEEDERASRSKKKKGAGRSKLSGKKKKRRDKDDEDDEDERPARSKKSGKKKRHRDEEEDDDDGIPFDEDDDDDMDLDDLD